MSFFTPVSPTGILPIWNYFKWSSLIQIFQTTKTEWIWTRNICHVRARLWLQILKEDFIFLPPNAKIKSGKFFIVPSCVVGSFLTSFLHRPMGSSFMWSPLWDNLLPLLLQHSSYFFLLCQLSNELRQINILCRILIISSMRGFQSMSFTTLLETEL